MKNLKAPLKRQQSRRQRTPLGEEQTLLGLPFDCYERYELTRRIVPMLWKGSAIRLTVLDVGGHSSSLKNFLPGHEVILADTQPAPSFTHQEEIPFRHDGYILAAGQKLPFVEASFDLVTSHDTLEHVPHEHRPAFLRELLRVARRFVVLNGPVYRPETARAEERLAEFIEEALARDHPYLREHLTLGLPNTQLIEEALEEQAVTFVKIPNGNLTLWLATMAVKHYLQAFPAADWPLKTLDRTYNTLISPHDFRGVCYREAYVIAKDRDDAPALSRIESAFAPYQPPTPQGEHRAREAADELEAVDGLLGALGEHARTVREELASRQGTIEALERTLGELRADIEAHKALLGEKESVLAQRQEALDRTRRDLEAVTGTLGYRLTEKGRAALHRLFPPGSWRRWPYRAIRRPIRWLLRQ